MSNNLSAEELQLIARMGFQIDDALVTHKKVDVEFDVSRLEGHPSLEDLSEFLKSVLRDD